MGYVGLPLLHAASESGLNCVGFDIDAEKISQLSESPIEGTGKQILFSSDERVIANSRYVVICVPTPLDGTGKPDLSFVASAGKIISTQLKRGQTIILESTVYPGATEQVLKPILEATGLLASKDFYLGYSPERVDPGNSVNSVSSTPRIISGLTDVDLSSVEDLYSKFLSNLVIAGSISEAETAKLLENIYRHINIALINEFAIACKKLGINPFNVIELSATKPFGFHKFLPSAGAGGHCIPIDPNYLNFALEEKNIKPLTMIQTANSINSDMAGYFVTLILDFLRENQVSPASAKVVVLGLTYKANVPDFRESPAHAIIDLLHVTCPNLSVHDPFLAISEIWGISSIIADNLLEESLVEADVILILQRHDYYIESNAILSQFKEKIVSPLNPMEIASFGGFL